MVTTCSRDHWEDNVLEPNLEAGQPRTSTDPNGRIASLEDHMKRMSKDMETLQKQNTDLISRLSLRRDREREERRKEKRGEDEQQSSSRDHEEIVEGGSSHGKDQEPPNVDEEVKDLKLQYEEMAWQMAQGGEDRSIVGNLLQNTNLPFIDRVIRFPLLEKFKVPNIDRYDRDDDLADHMESFRAHLVLHNTPDEIACRAFPLTLEGNAESGSGSIRQFLTQFLAV